MTQGDFDYYLLKEYKSDKNLIYPTIKKQNKITISKDRKNNMYSEQKILNAINEVLNG